jgi:hypothetical protein
MRKQDNDDLGTMEKQKQNNTVLAFLLQFANGNKCSRLLGQNSNPMLLNKTHEYQLIHREIRKWLIIFQSRSLCCDTGYIGRYVLTFHRKVPCPPSRPKSDNEEERNRFLRNVCICLPKYTMSQPVGL